MDRRTLLSVLATAGIGTAGCLGRPPSNPVSSSTTTSDSESTTLQADGVTATFTVGNGQQPTDDTASATRTNDGVVVTGTMDPTGCNRPTLHAVRYNESDAVINLVIGVTNPYPDYDVECGNASYEYTCRCVVDRGTPDTVALRYNYDGRDPISFTLRLS